MKISIHIWKFLIFSIIGMYLSNVSFAQQPICKYPQFDIDEMSNPIYPTWTPFTKCSNNKTLWDPSVIWDNYAQIFRLYFTRYNSCTKHMHIYTTESIDGLNWTSVLRDIHDPTREPSWGQGIMDNFETTAALQLNDSTIYLYFSGYTIKNRIERIGLLISTDYGQTYIPFKNNPIISPTEIWETQKANGIKEPTVIFDKSDSLYKIWYNVTDYNKITRVGYAWSSDGIKWTKFPNNPIFPPLTVRKGEEWAWEVNHVNVVQDPSFGYHMFYLNHMAIFQSYSEDGINWTREPGFNPQIMYSYDSAYKDCPECPWKWDNLDAYGSPSVIFMGNGDIYMFYMRTIPGAESYGKNPPNVNGTGGMMLGLSKGRCILYTSEDNNMIFKETYIFPNPASDFIMIDFNINNEFIEIYNLIGLKVIETKHENRINIMSLTPGIYFLKSGLNIYKFIKI